MDYKEKYKMAFERARKNYDVAQDLCNGSQIGVECFKNTLTNIFPELAESEDEKIRKEIIEYIKTETYHKNWIAWLEKQDKNPQGKSALEDINEEKIDKQNCIKPADFKAEHFYVSKVDGQIHDMTYNPTDKVEPNFKVGDWVVFNNQHGSIYQVEKIENYEYTLRHIHGGSLCLSFSNEELIRDWTIEDAKDGNVLASEDKDKVFLYNGKLDLRGRVCAYCGIHKTYDGLRFTECAIGNYFTYKEPHPATKEQRDTLFSKMKEAGYEWNAEKKELKKIEREDDTSIAIHNEKAYKIGFSDGEAYAKEQLVWSEEDERNMQNIDSVIFYDNSLPEDTCMRLRNWLKSVKQRIG